MTLYEKLGGEAGIATVVADFYDRMLADELVAGWFGESDGEVLKMHLRAYLAVALGGPEQYSGRSLRNAHAGLAITEDAWDRVVGHLAGALAAAGVDEPLIADVAKVIGKLKAVIVQVQAGTGVRL